MMWIGIGSVFVLLVAGVTSLLLVFIRFKRDMTIFYNNAKERQEAIERKFEMLKEWKLTVEDVLGVRVAWESKIESQMGVRFEWESTIDKTLGIRSDWDRRRDLFRKLFERYKDE